MNRRQQAHARNRGHHGIYAGRGSDCALVSGHCVWRSKCFERSTVDLKAGSIRSGLENLAALEKRWNVAGALVERRRQSRVWGEVFGAVLDIVTGCFSCPKWYPISRTLHAQIGTRLDRNRPDAASSGANDERPFVDLRCSLRAQRLARWVSITPAPTANNRQVRRA